MSVNVAATGPFGITHLALPFDVTLCGILIRESWTLRYQGSESAIECGRCKKALASTAARAAPTTLASTPTAPSPDKEKERSACTRP